ncbi:MAG: uracil-DNA glycosylase [Oscillospiraceae bacterium]|jgi:DNA polymerase|nr:uracil-DNA glycosylase [Oscillospiraceae bacterium]
MSAKSFPGAVSGMTAAWNRLKKECADFFRQIYVGEDRVLVFGEGDENARWMLVGEAPGEKEALAGRPFVGKAGEQLDAFLQAFELRREELYVTNAVKFRPTRVSAAGRTVNRTPTQEEIALWRPWLQREIELIKPKMVITMGNTALRAATGAQLMIGDVHGQTLPDYSPPIFPLYHPASVIYRKALHETYLNDLTELKAVIENVD